MTNPEPARWPAPALPNGDVDDRRLVERVRAGDGAALEIIFRAHYAALCGFLTSHVGSREAAEEVVQDLFLRIWERRNQWVVQGTLRGYLYSAARHRALNTLRHRRIHDRWAGRAVHDGHPAGMGDRGGDADARVRTAELARTLSEAIAALPPRCREVYILRTQHEMSHAEIAETMGISRKAVEFQLTRAFKSVAERVDLFLR